MKLATLVPRRITLLFVAVAAATIAGGVLSSRALAAARRDSAALVDGWRSLAALERACASRADADASVSDIALAARCAAERPVLEDELSALERAAARSAAVTTPVVLATQAALLVLLVVAAFALRGHLRERARREEEHARVLELQEQVLGMVGHDLRTPLSAIAGSAALLARAPDLPSSRVPLAQRIVSSAGRMSRMVRDLLDFTRVRAEGRLPLSPEPVDLGALCRRVVQEVRAARPETLVRCVVEGDVTGEWDPGRLEQVVSNLVTNACHHGARGRPVEVRATGLDDAVRITVHNEGPPIPGDVLPRIFDPFWRGDDRGGLGLGLHIVRCLVEAHGGTIEVRSGDDGTTFAVVLPAPVARTAPRTHASHADVAH